jgi:hypothetical protein
MGCFEMQINKTGRNMNSQGDFFPGGAISESRILTISGSESATPAAQY